MKVNLALLNNQQNLTRINLPLLLLFMLSLVPIVVEGVSINYIFVLVAALLIFKRKVITIPKINISIGILSFLIIFLISLLYHHEYITFFWRRFGSFLIFMSIFSFCFIKINDEMIMSFKVALILTSAMYSLISIFAFFDVQLSGHSFEIKNTVGGNRYGFVLLAAFWVLLVDFTKLNMNKILKVLVFILIILGVALTFSRSAIVALFVSGSLYFLHYVLSIRRIYFPKSLILWISLLIVTAFLLLKFAPVTTEYYISTLLNPFFNNSLYESIFISHSSEGIRLVRLNEVLNYVILNPITGSGYLGIWSFSETGSGSTHGQFSDVLLRVGFFGFFVYLYLITIMTNFFWKQEKSFFWAIIVILIYGLFHESFKEPQGAFIFAILLGTYSHYSKKNKFYHA